MKRMEGTIYRYTRLLTSKKGTFYRKITFLDRDGNEYKFVATGRTATDMYDNMRDLYVNVEIEVNGDYINKIKVL